MEKIKSAKLNLISMLVCQAVGILSGFILPRLILVTFGSEVNGLTSSLAQFLSYISLFEGGVSTVFTTCLYAPLEQKDEHRISSIVKTSTNFFNKLGLMFLFYTCGVAVIYPVFVKSDFSIAYVASLTFIIAISTYAQYMFCISYKILLVADNKGHVVYFIQAACYFGSLIASIIAIKLYPSIHLVKLVSSIFFFIQPIIFSRYARKKYDIDSNVEMDEEASYQKWSGFGQNFATFIYRNTDIVVLTIFSTLTSVSVYSVYYMILNAVREFVKSAVVALTPSIGNTYVLGDSDLSNRAYDKLEYIVFASTAFMFSCAAALMMPFIAIYTRGINDAEYFQPLFGFLLLAAFAIECIREPYLQLTFIAGHFRETSLYAYIEALLNVCISVAAVSRYGLIGVAVGTLFAVTFRTMALAWYNKSHVLYRPIGRWSGQVVLLGVIVIFTGVLFSKILIIDVSNYLAWVLYAVIVALASILLILFVSLIFFREQLVEITKMIRH